LGLLAIGLVITIIGSYIAFNVATKQIQKRDKSKTTNPIEEFRRRLNG